MSLAYFVSINLAEQQIKASAQVNVQLIQKMLVSPALSCWKGKTLHEARRDQPFGMISAPPKAKIPVSALLLCLSFTFASQLSDG